jgi:hypothetical protein
MSLSLRLEVVCYIDTDYLVESITSMPHLENISPRFSPDYPRCTPEALQGRILGRYPCYFSYVSVS